MAVTLAQAAVLSTNMLQRGVIQTFIDESPILDRLPFMEIEGNAYQYTQESSLPGIAFRAVNAGYTESTGAVVNATVGLKIFGGDADVDRFIARTLGNLNDQRAIQTRLKAKAAAIFFTLNFFEGDSTTPEQFDGLRKTLTGNQVVAAGANGATLTLAMLDDLISRVPGGPDVIYAPSQAISKINALVLATGVSVLPVERDQYGKLVRFYAGIPLVDPGYATDGTTQILAYDETQGASAVTTSIYAVKFGEQEFVSGLTNGGIDVYDLGELETKPAYRTRIEAYMAIGIFNGKAAARLKGIIAG
jgi:hypothetical protein